jgi:23S rRNA pseudouridine1911/1915/1917 synthase
MKILQTVSAKSVGTRLDRFLAAEIEDLSRTRIKDLITQGCITRNGESVQVAHKVAEGEEYVCVIPEVKPVVLEAEDIPLDIVYEDSDIIVINKPAGLVVHPAPGHASGTLVNALLGYCDELPVIGGEQRPGIVHRLDKDTSGLIVVARNDKAMQGMQAQFKDGTVDKVYAAIVRGLPKGKGSVESEIGRSHRDRKKMASVEKGGRYAHTEYQLREAFGDYALVEVKIHTGRTHQIRVHMSDIGHPVLGDAVYGGRRGGAAKDDTRGVKPSRQLLHAWKLSFDHPVTKERLDLQADFPEDFNLALEQLRQSK